MSRRPRFPLLAVAVAAVAGCASPASEPSHATSSAIVGGTTDTADKAVVAVLHTAGLGLQLCTGVLLGPNLVLTSRTCASTTPPTVDCTTSTFGATNDPASLQVAGDDVVPAKPAITATVAQILVPSDAHVCGANLALLVLGAPLSSSPTPYVPRLDGPASKGDTFTFVGYGAMSPAGDGAQTRRSLAGLGVTCVGTACSGAVASELGAGGGPCQGDGGGPAIAGDGRVFAINARGDQSCTTSIFQSLDAWADFLRAGAATAATAGGYAPPSWAGGAGDGGADTGVSTVPVPQPGDDAGTPGSSGGASSSSGGSSHGGCSLASDGSNADQALAFVLGALVVAGSRRRRRR